MPLNDSVPFTLQPPLRQRKKEAKEADRRREERGEKGIEGGKNTSL